MSLQSNNKSNISHIKQICSKCHRLKLTKGTYDTIKNRVIHVNFGKKLKHHKIKLTTMLF